jgi:hypothetical protein
MRKPLILFLAVTFVVTGQLSAQSMGSSYQTAIGVKFWPGALSIKHFVSDNRALEGLVSFWDRGFRVTGLYEIHGDFSDVPGLKWYVGPGLHVGAYNGNVYHDHYYASGDPSLGIDGILGVEYKFNVAPIALSVDVQPYLELLGHPYIDVWGGLGVKYTF